MINKIVHANVSLSDWQAFRSSPPQRLVEVVIDGRHDLPSWYVPSARGVAVASNQLLRAVGYHSESKHPRGWIKNDCGVFVRQVGWKTLFVRQYGDEGLWTVERWNWPGGPAVADEVLVLRFGSTPIFTRDAQSAMRLASHCHEKEPPSGLHWISAVPKVHDVKFAS